MKQRKSQSKPMIQACAMGIAVLLVGGTLMPQDGQEFTMTTTTEADFGGALQFIMNLSGVGGPKTQRTMASGPMSTVRIDEFEDGELTTSQITNYRSGDMYSIDHEDESYIHFNFNDFFANGGFRFGAVPDTATMDAPARAEPEQQGVEYSVNITFESPGETKTILGYRAERSLMTLTATPTRAPEGQSVDSMPIFVMLTELWTAPDFPGNTAMRELSDSAAAFLRQTVALDGEAMSEAFTMNPQFADAFERNQEEMQKVEGVPLEQLSAFVSLSPGAELNADSALHGSMGELKIDVAGAVTSGIRGAIGRRLGGIGGLGGRRSDEQEETPPMTQILMFRMRELVTEYTSRISQPGWTEVPAGYQERENPFGPPR